MNQSYIILILFTSITLCTIEDDISRFYGPNHKSQDTNYDIKEMKRINLVKLISIYGNDRAIAIKLVDFLNSYPIYNNPQQKFNRNYTLYQYLEKYGKIHCWPISDERNPHELQAISPIIHYQARSVESSPSQSLRTPINNSQLQSVEVSPEYSQRNSENISPFSNISHTKQRQISSHKCGKTTIVCAFTCF